MLDEISLPKFLARYLNLTGKDLSKITHEDVKVLFPFLKRTSFEKIELALKGMLDPEEAYEILDRVLLVNDGKHVVPYLKPELLTEEMDDPLEVVAEAVPKRKIDRSHHDYASMSIYELKCLLERKFNSARNRKKAKEELQYRGVVLSKKYDRNKDKKKWKEEKKNEGY